MMAMIIIIVKMISNCDSDNHVDDDNNDNVDDNDDNM